MNLCLSWPWFPNCVTASCADTRIGPRLQILQAILGSYFVPASQHQRLVLDLAEGIDYDDFNLLHEWDLPRGCSALIEWRGAAHTRQTVWFSIWPWQCNNSAASGSLRSERNQKWERGRNFLTITQAKEFVACSSMTELDSYA
eukprot:1874359-Pleurochrysis_carterae.AAC.4